MNLSLYSGATGMQAQQLNLNVISNNIANVNTTGYKKNKIEFQDLLYQNPRQAGGQTGAGNVIPTGVEMGNGPRSSLPKSRTLLTRRVRRWLSEMMVFK